jgi:hypothetical protein
LQELAFQPASGMVATMKLLLLFAPAILLSSCAVPGPRVHGSAGSGYSSGYYGHSAGYYDHSNDIWDGDAYDHYPSGSSHHRHVRTPFSSKDDVRKDADHRTSPNYSDPHHGGSTHGHDAAGHRIDSHGHHVDAVGNHTSNPDSISHSHESGSHGNESGSRSHSSESASSSRSPEPGRHEASRSDDSSSSRGENKMEDLGRRGKD